MSKCLPWSNHRRTNQHTYIYLYTSEMNNSSRLSRCLITLIFIFSLIIIITLISAIIYHYQNHHSIITKQYEVALAKKRQLPFFVNLNIDPCENFIEFVCDKWTILKSNLIIEQKSQRIQRYLHNQLMNYNSSSIQQFYQLCENQSPEFLINEFEEFIKNFIQQEPYHSYLTIYNQTKKINYNESSSIIILPYKQNPFWSIEILNQTINLTRIYPRLFLSPIDILRNIQSLNQTALNHLIFFNNKYEKFFINFNETNCSYEHEYNQDSLLVKRILTYSNYHQCLPTLNSKSNGLQNLIDLLNYFLQSRLNQLNTKLIDKQIRILDKLTDNHTLIEHLKRIRTEFHMIANIIIDKQNTTCIIDLLDQLLDEHFRLNEISENLNFYFDKKQISNEYLFISNDWPYLVMLTEHLLKNLNSDLLINFVFFNYYRQLIYPYYQPHIHNLIQLNNSIKTCFDIFNSSHPSLLNQIIDESHQISINLVRTIVENVLERFRFLIEQSDNLFTNEKNFLINHFQQIQIRLIHFSSIKNRFLYKFNFTTYLDYVQYFSSIPLDKTIRSYSIEPIYISNNHTLFLPYGYIFLSNSTIEYSLTHFLLKFLKNILQSNPFYIECLIKTIDEQITNNTLIDTIDEHIIYLLFRSKYLDEKQINLDEYLWPFMNANYQMKQFLINYTADYYCLSTDSYQIFRNNTYLIDDIHLVFNCPQASSIKQSKCIVN